MRPFSIPDLADCLQLFGKPEMQHLPDRLKILVWNVYKGKKGNLWKTDFLNLCQDRDLILLQEAMIDGSMPKIWEEDLKSHQWKMATSFAYQNKTHRTGVATGSRFLSTDTQVYRGSEREIFVWTPKVTLSSFYQTEDANRSLLVINTHVVNFTTTKGFVRYIDEILSKIIHHKGPLLMAGDFNTWNLRRWTSLLRMLRDQNMEHVLFPNDQRFLKLDHVFVRDLEVKSARIKSEILSSDHSPLELEVNLKP